MRRETLLMEDRVFLCTEAQAPATMGHMSYKGKMRQSAKAKRLGTYAKQYARTVKRIGRWRGKKVKL